VTAPSSEFLALQACVAGRYSIERELGRGGMGIVFLARDVALNRPVAIKLLPAAFSQQSDMRERFVREARTAAGLFHPNIVPIHLVEERDGLVYFVMAYVEGESVGDRVRRAGPMSASATRRMLQEVSWALGYAHEKGVVHRDIKPDNILIERAGGRALVTDFGIARVADASGGTSRGELLGTVQFMSPEQATGEKVDGRSDLYSLGITAFFALTGRLPFEAENAVGYIHKHVSVPAPRVASLATQAPAKLAEAIDKCLAKEPSQRFATGEALAQALADAGEAAQELPPEIRVLLRRIRTASVVFGFLSGSSFLLIQMGDSIVRAVQQAEWWVLVALASLVVGGTVQGLIRLVRDARRCVKRGYGAAFVHDALSAEALAMIEEGALELGARGASPAPKVPWYRFQPGSSIGNPNPVLKSGINRERTIGQGRLLGVATAAMFAIAAVAPGKPTGFVLFGLLALAATLLAFFAGPAVGEDSPLVALDWGERLLIGRFGRLLFRAARIRLKDQAAPAIAAVGQRTEVALSIAIDDLIRALPSELRGRFAHARDVTRQLEATATALRGRDAKLSDTLARVDMHAPSAGSGGQDQVKRELESARAGVRERLATTVATIETIRLDLLRLQAGVGGADHLTAEIERARALGEAIDADIAGRKEVEALLAPNTTA
jgi:hypothetical protein